MLSLVAESELNLPRKHFQINSKMEKTKNFNNENCFVCFASLDCFKNSIDATSGYSGTPIFEFIETFTGAPTPKKGDDRFYVCQECFLTFDKFDEMQCQLADIQNKITYKFQNTHREKGSFKPSKASVCDPDVSNDVSFQCKKCIQPLRTRKDLENHKHNEVRKRCLATCDKLTTSISKYQCKDKKKDIDCNLATFQNAFFSENEKNSPAKITHSPSFRPRSPVVSKDFVELLKSEGIEYNLDAFQKAFGYSEQECMTSKSKFESSKLSQSRSAKKKISAMNEKLVRSLEAEGVVYDLAAFQKAFGFVHIPDEDFSEFKDVDHTSEELKHKGFIGCQTCSAKLSTRNSYTRHVRSHLNQAKSFFCDQCTKNFKSLLFLHLHIATDHGRNTGPVDCPICLKHFTDSKALRSHVYIHQDEKKFLCSRCGASFTHKKSYESHILIHDDIRPFPCIYEGCTKRFRQSTKLKVHLRVHTGEKKYECPYCPGKRFSQKYGMDLHINKQHKNMVVKKELCNLCGVKVQSKAKMKQHLINMHQLADDGNLQILDGM